jgi:hypothetical protein
MGALVMCAFAVSACGGGGGTSAPVPAQPKTTSGVGRVAFSIIIPAQTAAAAHRKPAYVSPSTQSVSFAVGSATPQVVAIVPGSANCPSNGNGGYTCTADANVTAGANQSLTVKTYASTDGTGAVLSQNTITVTVVAAQTNPVTVTLNGVAASLALTVSPSGSVTRCTPSTLTATWSALDAQGNTIVGPGTITNAAGTTVAPTLTSSDTTHFTIGTASGNTWPVTYNGAGGGLTGPITLSATFTGVTTGTAPVAIAAGSLLFSRDGNAIGVFAPPYTGAATVITNGISGPTAVRVNSSCTLFVANYGGGNVTAYVPPYTGAPVATITASTPVDLALTGASNLWVLNTSPNSAAEYAPPYTGAAVATFPITSASPTPPTAIAVDSSNDVFVVDQVFSAGYVFEYSPPYSSAPTTVNAMYVENAIVSPSNNDLFITTVGDYVGVLPPPYSTESANIAPVNNSGAAGLALDAQNDLFVAYESSSTVVEYAPPYTGGAAATITSGVSFPQNVAVDPATGNLFVANSGRAPTITVLAPPYTGAPP